MGECNKVCGNSAFLFVYIWRMKTKLHINLFLFVIFLISSCGPSKEEMSMKQLDEIDREEVNQSIYFHDYFERKRLGQIDAANSLRDMAVADLERKLRDVPDVNSNIQVRKVDIKLKFIKKFY